MSKWIHTTAASILACLAAGSTGAQEPIDPVATANEPQEASATAPSAGDDPKKIEDPPPATATATSPEAKLINAFNQSLLSLLESNADFDARYAIIEPVVAKTFDLEFMAAKVLGRGWKDLTPEQREQWLATFTRLTASNYAGRFVGEKGPSFENRGEQAGSHDTVVVMTRLIDPKGEDVDLNYRMRETNTGWKVIDCYMNGTVSEIALRRSEYGSVLRRDGFEALVSAVNETSDALATTPPA